jgi:hypothetical protein
VDKRQTVTVPDFAELRELVGKYHEYDRGDAARATRRASLIPARDDWDRTVDVGPLLLPGLADLLRSLPVQGETLVDVAWPSEARAIRTTFETVAAAIGTLWWPSSDDLFMWPVEGAWELWLDHEETLHFGTGG